LHFLLNRLFRKLLLLKSETGILPLIKYEKGVQQIGCSKEIMKDKTPKNAYSQAVGSGQYAWQTGLRGKYDNVRLYWEDEITRLFLQPFFYTLIERRKAELQRIRILDLGCGSGDGLELLNAMVKKKPGIFEHEIRILNPDLLGFYKGIDLNESLLKQAEERFSRNGKIVFEKGDFSKGLPIGEKEEGYDIYLTSYGSLSHLNDEEMVHLLSDIGKHAEDGALVVCDWLGRYAYEWQDLWQQDISKEQWMDYRISYIYPEEERLVKNIESFSLRLMCEEEVMRNIHKAQERSGIQFIVKKMFDRSLVVGRHMDTGDYNKNAQPLRRKMNYLYENYQRSYFEGILFDYYPREDFVFLNHFFENLQSSWNTLIRYTMEICHRFDEEKGIIQDPPSIAAYYPEPLKSAMETMKRVVSGCGWFGFGDARANIIEPQLYYALRSLEMAYQQGKGFGHGLAAILEVNKS
jgi:SAM-dependent methyltransferase